MVYLPIYKVGEYAYYNDRPYKIEHIVISGYDLLVKLDGIDRVIEAEKVSVTPTKLEIRGKSGDRSVS